jgi:hypothetical protein
MANIHDVFKDDDVNGVIIGSVMVTGYLWYGDKKANYRQLYAYSDAELQEKAIALKNEMLEENKDIIWHLWPDASKWSLRINQ